MVVPGLMGFQHFSLQAADTVCGAVSPLHGEAGAGSVTHARSSTGFKRGGGRKRNERVAVVVSARRGDEEGEGVWQQEGK